jgi:hypothetical protein
MSDLRQAAQQALEAMNYTGMDVGKFNRINAASAALRAALEQRAEPVAGVKDSLTVQAEPQSCPDDAACRDETVRRLHAEVERLRGFEDRAERAEQAVVELSEERDHFKALAEPQWCACKPTRCEWQGMTEEEIWGLAANCLDSVAGRLQFARAIEAKLKEKNHG